MDVYQVPKRSIILIKVFISLAILAILFALTDVTKMLSVMMDINPLVILFSVFLCFSQMVLAGVRWHTIGVRTGDFFDFFTTIKINSAAMFSNQILPTSIGGDLVKTALARQGGLALGRAIRTVILDRITGLISLIFLLAATCFFSENYVPKEWGLNGIQFIIVPILSFLLVALYNGAKISTLCQRFNYLKWSIKFLNDASALFRSGWTAVYTVCISVFIHSIGALCVWMLALELGLNINYIFVLAFLPLISLAQLIPVSIAGWGVREGAVVSLFALMGLDPSISLVVSLLWGTSIVLAAVLSGLIWIFMRSGNENLRDIRTSEFYN